MTGNPGSSVKERPFSRLGRTAVRMGIVFVVMFIINQAVLMQLPEVPEWIRILLILYGIVMVLCGLGTGILGLTAILRNKERSWMVWLTLLPGAFMLFLLAGELLFPH